MTTESLFVFAFSFYDNEEDGVRFEERLSLEQMELLETWFKKHRPPPRADDSSAHARGSFTETREAGLLNRAEFKSVVEEVLGTSEYSNNLDTLFTKVGTGY